jgi:hypothetical protein
MMTAAIVKTATDLLSPLAGAEVQVNTPGLTAEQNQWVVEIKVYEAMRQFAGMERAKRLRDLRDSRFPVTGKVGKEGNNQTRKGWADFLRSEFDVRVDDANYEIAGLAALEQALSSQNEDRPAGHQLVNKIGTTHLQEIGRANGLGSKVAAKVLERGTISKQAIRTAKKEVKEAEKLAGMVTHAPAKPKAAPKAVKAATLKISQSATDAVYELSKYRGSAPVTAQQEWCEAHIEKMRAAAVKYKNLCKQLNDHFSKGIADDRNFPARMTVMAILWKEKDYDFDAALDVVTDELEEAHRLWGLAMDISHGSAEVIE